MKPFKKNIQGKTILRLFILTNLVYVFMLIVTIPKTMAFSGGLKLLDMMPTGYDLGYVNELFNTLGETGRKFYLTKQIPVDMFYPLLFGITYSLLLAFFLKKLDGVNSKFSYLCFIPIIAAVADYFENFGIIVMLKNYPELTETLVGITCSFSLVKSISTSVFFLILIIVLVLLGIKTMKNR